MFITTNGIIQNDAGDVLLIRRNDSRTLAPPGGGLNPGELPPDGAVREVYEETGLHVIVERLVGVYYWPRQSSPFLTFSFRCRPVGGTIRPSIESPHVGYYKTGRLPLSMMPFHRRRVEIGLAHQSATPYWGIQQMNWYENLGKNVLGRIVYPYWRWRLRRKGLTADPVAQWRVGAFTVIRNEAGQVLWLKRRDRAVWNLPGGGQEADETPWQTAVRETHEECGLTVTLTHLSGVYLYHDLPQHAVFVFTAQPTGGTPQTSAEAAEWAYFTPGSEPANAMPQHVARVANACQSAAAPTVFRFQTHAVAPCESE